ncbi:hypothetical protein N474_25305 [Pseudoalteromonas luteoviolacea CPMOR-2]|uniref:DUF2306 domain-containing protein n=2 Tax=Pseudoalteromonas luteoviolacea TaxID=43657 RepID=A0A166V764_9GAMM|nr:hypothetical protein N475_22875 [Pseudoalteromonas luteoviolacea DSM 6061]KZN59584.1 hypothetical protein N474_25305 [Pseudoalteromonas luteoviolacea CPMOR-2]MBE0387175.1 hypothetical protein [Pseudoalteromonas luteoviolacea DSM 6061]TQF73123.1 hypothetical protein FLM44_13465 [Pseudoalteromonas luteoviolacea]
MLTVHIIAGAFLLLFGIGALSFAKGKTKHRWSGNLFFLSMLIMAGTAASFNGGATMALLTFYYGTTAWAVVLRKENTVGIFEALSMCLIIYVSFSLFHFVYTATDIPQTFKTIFTIHASVAALSACLDLKMLLSGGLSGKHRIVRHTWRACFAMLGAVMSFSSNTSDSWPDFIDSNALIYLMIGVLFYWLIRVLFTNWYKQLTLSIGNSILIKRLTEARRLLYVK